MDILCDRLETENVSLEMNFKTKTIQSLIFKIMVQLTDNNLPCRQHQRHTYSVCSFIQFSHTNFPLNA